MKSPLGIEIYDDEFTKAQRDAFWEFVKVSRFIVSGKDVEVIESPTKNIPFLISEWSEEDIRSFNIFSQIHNTKLTDNIKSKTLVRCLVNLDTLREIHHVHTHPHQHVLLYQANPEWRPEWYGETLFYDDNAKDVIYTNEYTPGRLIWFDGNIPHTFRPPSQIAPFFRFTVSMFFK